VTLTVRMSLRRLRSRKLSLVLSSFIIAWAMAMLVAGMLSSQVLEVSSTAYLDDLGMPDMFVSLSEGRPIEEVEDALSSSAIDTYDLRLRANGRATVGGAEVAMVLIGTSQPVNGEINRLTLLEGRSFAAPEESVMVAGSKMSMGSLEVTVNGLPLELNIVGKVRSAEFLINELETGSIVPGSGGMTVIYLPLTTLQTVLGQVVNDISMMIDDVQSREEVEAALSTLPVSSMTYREDHQTSVIIQMGVDKFEVMLPTISIVFIFIGLISIFITMYRLVLSDSRNIGMLMSLGIDRWRIASSYLAIAGVILVLGGALGVLMAYGFTAMISQIALDMMGQIPFVMPFAPLPFLTGLLVIVTAVITAVLVPVALVLRQSVNDALRYVPRTRVWTFGRATLTLATSLGLRNLFREPKRAAVVLMAIGLSIGAAGSWVLMVDSTQTYFDEQMSAQRWDVRITFNAPLDSDQAINDFTYGPANMTIPFVTLNGVASSDRASVGAAVLAASDIEGVRTFELRRGSLDFEGAVLAKKMAEELKVSPGEWMTLNLGGRTETLLVTGEVNDLQTNAIYTSNASVMALLGEGLCQGVFVVLDDPANTAGYVSVLAGDPMVGGIELKEDVRFSLSTMYEGAISMLYAFFALNLLIALAVAVLATIISTAERDVEFTALASLGLPRSFIWRSLAVEVGTQATISAMLSIPFAFFLAKVFATMMEEAVFYIPIILSIATTVTVVVIGWLFVWPSIIWPIRWFRRLDLVRTLRERSSR
jgi:ABC-type antimicrobial peptide transport system permease subunit